MTSRHLAPVLVCVVLTTGCASASGRYRVAAATETFAAVLVQAQMVVIEGYARGQIPQAQYLRWQAAFVQLARAGKTLVAALRSRQEPAAIDAVLSEVLRLMNAELGGLPEDVRTPMRGALEALRVSALLMAVAGGG